MTQKLSFDANLKAMRINEAKTAQLLKRLVKLIIVSRNDAEIENFKN